MSVSTISLRQASTFSAPSAFTWKRYALRGLATILAAVLANTACYFIGSAVVTFDPDFIVLANVSGAIIFTLVPAIVATLLYAGLLRMTRHCVGAFQVISAIVFVLTLIPDFTYIPTVPGSSPAQTALLVLMHVVAAVVIVRLLTDSPRRLPSR